MALDSANFIRIFKWSTFANEEITTTAQMKFLSLCIVKTASMRAFMGISLCVLGISLLERGKIGKNTEMSYIGLPC